MSAKALNDIYRLIPQLAERERIALARYLLNTFRPSEEMKVDIRSLRGIGQRTWSSDEVDSYIAEERASWD